MLVFRATPTYLKIINLFSFTLIIHIGPFWNKTKKNIVFVIVQPMPYPAQDGNIA